MRRSSRYGAGLRRAGGVATLVLVGAFMATCTGGERAPTSATTATTATTAMSSVPQGSFTLFDHLAGARIECGEVPALQGEFVTARPDEILFRDDFADGKPAAGWIEGLASLSSTPRFPGSHVLSVKDAAAAERVMALPPKLIGLHRFVATPDGAPVVVRARLRQMAPAASAALPANAPPALEVVAIEQLPADPTDPFQVTAVTRGSQRRPGQKTLHALARRGASPIGQEGFEEIEVSLPPHRERAGLRLSLNEGAGLLVDWVEVRRLTAAADLGREPRLEPEARGPFDRCVRVGRDSMRSLPLPVPTTLAFDVTIPMDHPRFDAATGLRSSTPGTQVTLRLAIDGEEIAARTLTRKAGGDGFTPWTLPLDRFAGQRVRLTVASAGAGDAVALLGNPWLLSPAPDPTRMNLLLISIDTLRRDMLGCYGNPDPLTPAIDRLAAEGTRFAESMSPVSYTLPAHASLFTGQHPLVHGARKIGERIDPRTSPLLGARLKAEGWQTAAFTGGGMVDPDNGFGIGFDSYSISDPGGVTMLLQPQPTKVDPATDSFAALAPALSWLDRHADQPFFLFVHTFFVHNYDPSPDMRQRFGVERPPWLVPRGILSPAEFDELIANPRAGAPMRQLYQCGVAEVDERLVRPLLERLDALHLSDRTLVVLVADHGEEFREHGGLLHGRHLWGELTRVPFIVRGPGVASGVVRDLPVSLVDVAPTIARHLGLPDDLRSHGRVLGLGPDAAREEAGDPGAFEPIVLRVDSYYEEGDHHWDGLYAGPWTLLRRYATPESEPEPQLFDGGNDLAQQHDLAAQRAEQRALLERRLDHEIARLAAFAQALPAHGERKELDPELEAQLRALGYGER